MRRGGFAEKGYNTPCRIGHAICLPGDVVYGCQSGVYFIPAHLAETVSGVSEEHERYIAGSVMKGIDEV
jgi:regulator of RNase E activity RraA